jgi:AmmeMemoRadiSam system protein A
MTMSSDMLLMPSPDIDTHTYSVTDRRRLLDLALASIHHGLERHLPLPVRLDDYPEPLREPRATFVTLERSGQLRGCIGHLEAVQPLVQDVAENAWSAAFRDPRFAPLTAAELTGLELHISVLTPPRPLSFSSEADLLQQIRPGLDGLILEDGLARGTFLPAVWESLPRVEEFWRALKRKAGLPPEHWSPRLRVSRYETEAFS